MAKRAYTFRCPATVMEVHDGDTFKALIDVGWRIRIESVVRVAAVDAPELETAPGAKAAVFLAALLPVGCVVEIASKRLDGYGRTLADVSLDGADVGARLLEARQAVKRSRNGAK